MTYPAFTVYDLLINYKYTSKCKTCDALPFYMELYNRLGEAELKGIRDGAWKLHQTGDWSLFDQEVEKLIEKYVPVK